MEEREVEKQLKEDAANLKKRDFSERWEVIKDKIQHSEAGMRDEVLCEQKVAVSTSGSHSESRGVKKKVLFCAGLVVLLIAVCLAIVLPITLRKHQERFFALSDLKPTDVTQSQFEETLQSAHMQIIDLSDYELDMFYILATDDGKIMGGGVDILDLETESFSNLVFYSSNVKSEFDTANEYKICNTNNIEIKYVTTFKGDHYSTVAIADSGKIIYELTCTTSYEDVIPVFERLFGNN